MTVPGDCVTTISADKPGCEGDVTVTLNERWALVFSEAVITIRVSVLVCPVTQSTSSSEYVQSTFELISIATSPPDDGIFTPSFALSMIIYGTFAACSTRNST